VFIAQRLVRLSKQLKTIIQIEHKIVKNPNWPEANQLAIYKCGRGFELGATVKEINLVVRAGIKPTCTCRTTGLQDQHADHSVTPPPKSNGMILRAIWNNNNK